MIEVARISTYMRGGSAPPTQVLARIALRQHGVASRAQILALGVGASFIDRHLRDGRLHRLHAGVYAVGHRSLTRESRWMAAVLACGERSLLSHLSAALLWELIDRAGSLIHVLVPGCGSRRRPGLVIHRTRDLPPEQRDEADGIPVTSPHRTLLDLAAMLPVDRLRYAVEAAERRGCLDVPALFAICDASPGRRGAGTLGRIAREQRGDVGATKSRPESAFLRLCLAHGLPDPLVNSKLHGCEVDFLWPEARLVAEVDTYTYHRSWAQRQRDLARDADLAVHGYEILRFTRERVEADASAVAAQVAAVLGLREAAGLQLGSGAGCASTSSRSSPGGSTGFRPSGTSAT